MLNTQNMTNLTIALCPWSKWNMGEIYGVKMMVKSGLEKIFLKFFHVIFITEFVLMTKTPPFYEVNL